jgi:FkbH-like protein
MPEVAVIDVPPNPEMYTQALDDAETFDSLNLVDEDFARAEMYQTERRRLDFREVQPDLGSFLRDLQIHVVIGTVNREMMPRVVQLLGKTNQFNLTTRRYTASELERMVSEGAIALWIRSQDRFGDDGLVGVAIAVEDPGAQWRIDTFLMSCRVIGRGIESILLTTLGEQVAARGGKRLMGEFVRSSKNALVENFYREQGYSPEDGGGQHWATQLDGARPQGIDHIAVEFTEHDEFTRAKG